MIFKIVLFLFLFASCSNAKNAGGLTKNRINTSTKVVVNKEVPIQVELDSLLLEHENFKKMDIREILDKIEGAMIHEGYVRQKEFSNQQYKWKDFQSMERHNVFYEAQYSKPKNRKFNIIAYSYDDKNIAIETFVKIKNSNILDAIFKSGGLLFLNDQYLIQVASTCAISRTELQEISKVFSDDLSHLFCHCGGYCVMTN